MKCGFEATYVDTFEGKHYSCTTTSKSFKQNGHLKQHMLIHTDTLPYSVMCNKHFKQCSILKRRMQSDSNE